MAGLVLLSGSCAHQGVKAVKIDKPIVEQSVLTPEVLTVAPARVTEVVSEDSRVSEVARIRAIQTEGYPKILVNSNVYHYGDLLNLEVQAPGAEKIELTVNIEDPFIVPLPYGTDSKTWKITYRLPLKKETVIDEGAYVFTAIVHYPGDKQVKVNKEVWFKD